MTLYLKDILAAIGTIAFVIVGIIIGTIISQGMVGL